MFDYIGQKLKTTAKILFWVGAVGSVVGGLLYIAVSESVGGDTALIGLSVALFGPFASWVVAAMVAGFGQLVENSRVQTDLAMEHAMNAAERKLDKEATKRLEQIAQPKRRRKPSAKQVERR